MKEFIAQVWWRITYAMRMLMLKYINGRTLRELAKRKDREPRVKARMGTEEGLRARSRGGKHDARHRNRRHR